MNKQDDHIELFRKRMLSLLSKEEEQAFDARLSADEAFAKEYQEYKELAEVLIVQENEELKNHLSTLSSAPSKSEPVWWKAAAVVVVLFGVFAVYQWAPNEDPYQDYFDPYPNVLAPTTRSQDRSDSILKKAFSKYDSQDYQGASVLFEEVLQQDPSDSVQFYWAMSLLNAEQNQEAQSVLKELMEEFPQNEFKAETLWYYGLVLLKNEETEAAKEAFKGVLEYPGTFKKKEAQELLEQLP